MGKDFVERMLFNGIGALRFEFEVIQDSEVISRHRPVTDIVDLRILPTAIGGSAVSFQELPKLSAFLQRL